MLARLSNMGISLGELNTILDDPDQKDGLIFPLTNLTTRSSDDPSIALLDASAVLADVLTFYQERIANEGYLRTATERRSLIELVRLVGYTLRPGVAASVFLSYTLDNGRVTTIPRGSRSQSIPGPGQQPQFFETSFDIEARAAWNAIKPRMSVPQYITQIDPKRFRSINIAQVIDTDTADGAFYLDGLSTKLKPNDVLLFVFDDTPRHQVYGHALTVEPNPVQKNTRVTFPASFTPLVFIRKLLNIIDHYLDLSLFNIAPADPLVVNVVKELHYQQMAFLQQMQELDRNDGDSSGPIASQPRSLLSKEGSINGSTKRSTLLDDIVSWSGAYEHAVNQRSDKIAAWVGGLVTDLKALFLAVDPGVANFLSEAVNPIVTTSISTLVAQLAKPPSLQPANGTRLIRRVQSEFARKSAISLQMLGVLNQAAQPELLNAVSNARVTAQSALQTLYAMRVKASPFGSNAPKQAVPRYNDKGQVVGNDYREWPLTDLFPLVLSVPDFLSDHQTTLNMTVSLQQGSQTLSQTVSVPVPTTNSVEVDFSGVPTIQIDVATTNGSAGGPVKNITIKVGDLTIVATPTIGARDKIASWNVQIEESLSVSAQQTATFSNLEQTTITYDNAALSIANTVAVSLQASDLRRLDLDARYDLIVPDSWVMIEYGDSVRQPLIARVRDVQLLSRADFGISGQITRLVLDKPWLNGNESLLSDIRNVTIYAQSEELQITDEPLTDDIQGDEIELDDFYDGLKSGQWVVVAGERSDVLNTKGVITSELVMIASVEQHVRQTNTPPSKANQRGESKNDSSTASDSSLSAIGGIQSSKNGNSLSQPPQAALPNDKIHSFLHFANALSYRYKRSTVTVGANVVNATHGETHMEVLGRGDGAQTMQQFTLKQSPLTYVSAATPAGAESTLHVTVNDVEWHEVESLEAQGPKARAFISKTDEQDKTTIIFGDGQQHGARPPTGVENIKALYRTGIGQVGNVDAGQISMVITRPLGVKGVVNPKPATGGVDREGIAQARRNVPLATQALDRIVSVQDYADFARTYAGIGKASASTLPDVNRQLVHLTIAGQDNIPIDPTSDLYQNLFLALRTFGNPGEPLRVDVCEVKLLVVSLRVRVLPDYKLETVSPNIRTALLAAFSFEQRDLGQPVYESEVLSVVQQVPGVAFVDLDILDAVDQQTLLNALDTIHQQELLAAANGVQANETQDLLNLLNLRARQVVPSHLARPARRQKGMFLPAQLVFLSPAVQDTLIINELTSTHVALKSQKPKAALTRRVL